MPHLVAAPLAAGVLVLIIGSFAVLAGQPWLLPSLGPSAFLQTEKPHMRSSLPYHVAVGHVVGLLAGLLAVWVFGAADAPGMLASSTLVPERLWATALALTLTLGGMFALRATHPPAAAIAMLVALGAIEPTWMGVQVVLVGVVLITLFGEIARRLMVRILQDHDGDPKIGT